MFSGGVVTAGVGACVGILGGLAGNQLFGRLASRSPTSRAFTVSGLVSRSLAIGFLVALLYASISERGQAGVVLVSLSFLSALVHGVTLRTLVTQFGWGVVNAGELSLVVTIVLMALLYVSGVLWITLMVLGACVVLAVTGLNGLWIYRLR